jgi:hypothetical protein
MPRSQKIIKSGVDRRGTNRVVVKSVVDRRSRRQERREERRDGRVDRKVELNRSRAVRLRWQAILLLIFLVPLGIIIGAVAGLKYFGWF